MDMETFLKARKLDDDIMALLKVYENWDGQLNCISSDVKPFYVDNTNGMLKDIKARILKEIEIKKERFKEL